MEEEAGRQQFNLTVTALEASPMSMFGKTPSGEPTILGVFGHILEGIKRWTKFRFTIVKNEDPLGQYFENGTWTGLFGKLQRGEISMIFTSLGVTYKRGQAVDFGQCMEILSSIVVSKSRNQGGGIPDIINSFIVMDLQVVLLTIATALFLYTACPLTEALVVNVHDRHHSKERPNVSVDSSLWKFVVRVFHNRDPTSISARFMKGSNQLFVFFFITFLGSQLHTDLIAETRLKEIDSLAILAEFADTIMMVYKNSVQEEFFKESKEGYVKTIWQRSSKDPEVYFSHHKETIERLADNLMGDRRSSKKKYVFTANTLLARQISEMICNKYPQQKIHISRNTFYSLCFTVMMYRGMPSAAKRPIKKFFSIMVESGLYSKWVDEAFKIPRCFSRPPENPEINSLPTAVFRNTLLSCAGCLVGSTIVLLAEILLNRHKHHSK